MLLKNIVPLFKTLLLVALTFPCFCLAKLVGFFRIATRKPSRENLEVPKKDVRPSEMWKIFDEGKPAILPGFLRQFEFFELLKPEIMKEAWGDCKTYTYAAQSKKTGFLQESSTPYKVTYAAVIDHIFEESNEGQRIYCRLGGPTSVLNEIRDLCQTRRVYDHSNIWIGEEGNTTPFHVDGIHGFVGQTVGEKELILISPNEGALIKNSPFFSHKYNSTDPTQLPDDVRMLENENEPFWKIKRYRVILKPGDLLYIPPYWWHTAFALGPSISVLFRYKIKVHERIKSSAFLSAWGSLLHYLGVSVTKGPPDDNNDWNKRGIEFLRKVRV